MLSGDLGYYTSKIWREPEAHKFLRIAIERGVNSDAILVEDQSTNSGENIGFTRRLLETNGFFEAGNLRPKAVLGTARAWLDHSASVSFLRIR